MLAEVVRSGVIESRHRGSLVGLNSDGSVDFSVGDPAGVIFPRSSNKPLQATAMMRLGLDLDPQLLALACASHSGEPFHLDGVRSILAAGGLDETALGTPAEYPVDETVRLDYVRNGGSAAPLAMNCSGKHAAMLATCVRNGWPTATYRDADHPLQQAILETVEELAEEKVTEVGVDGCGAPLFGLSLVGLARAFRAVARAPSGTAEERVAHAIRSHPRWLGGSRRDVSRMVEGVPGLIAKDGAEGVYAAALPDGRAVALKIDDGAARARPPVLIAALRRLGAAVEGVADLAHVPVLGGGVAVGSIQAAAWPAETGAG